MTARRRPHRAGYAALGALMVLFSLAAVTAGGLAARTRDLAFEARSLRRHQARWAAESGLARARNRRAQRRSTDVAGRLQRHLVCDEVGYRIRSRGRNQLRATGVCRRAGRPDVLARIDVTLTGPGRGTVIDWREAPAPRADPGSPPD